MQSAGNIPRNFHSQEDEDIFGFGFDLDNNDDCALPSAPLLQTNHSETTAHVPTAPKLSGGLDEFKENRSVNIEFSEEEKARRIQENRAKALALRQQREQNMQASSLDDINVSVTVPCKAKEAAT